MHRRAAAVVLLLGLTGCTDLTKYRAEGTALVAELGPKLSALRARQSQLAARLAQLPADQPGAAPLRAQLDRHGEALAALSGSLASFSSTVDEAVKAGKESGVRALLANFKRDLHSQLATEEAALAALARQADALQATAPPSAPNP